MLFNVLTGKSLTSNAMKSGDRNATRRQTKEEHDALLDIRTLPEYKAILAMPPGPQKSLAIAALNAEAELREREYAKYWDDQYPRRNISQSSSWVGPAMYEPQTQLLTIELGGKSYTYPNVSPEGVARFLNSQSLGKFLNSKKPYTGQGF